MTGSARRPGGPGEFLRDLWVGPVVDDDRERSPGPTPR